MRDLSRVGDRAGITTGATLPLPSLANWFLERKLGDGYKDTFDQSDWAKRNTVLKVKSFKEASLSGLNLRRATICYLQPPFLYPKRDLNLQRATTLSYQKIPMYFNFMIYFANTSSLHLDTIFILTSLIIIINITIILKHFTFNIVQVFTYNLCTYIFYFIQ